MVNLCFFGFWFWGFYLFVCSSGQGRRKLCWKLGKQYLHDSLSIKFLSYHKIVWGFVFCFKTHLCVLVGAVFSSLFYHYIKLMLQKPEPCVSCGFEFGGTPPVQDAQQMQLRVADITTNKEEAFHHGARSSHALDSQATVSDHELPSCWFPAAGPLHGGLVPLATLFLCSYVTYSENSTGSRSLE